jgi:hypothetical protein
VNKPYQDVPNIDFGAATAHWSHASIGVVGGSSPALHIGLSDCVSNSFLSGFIGTKEAITQKASPCRRRTSGLEHTEHHSSRHHTWRLPCCWFAWTCHHPRRSQRICRKGHSFNVFSTHLVHCHEVECSIEPAINSGQVDVECEFVVHQREHLVLGGARPGHQVESRSDVGSILMLGDKLESQGVAACRRPVRGAVVRALECTILGTLIGLATDRSPPR